MKNSGPIIAGVGNLYIAEIGEAFPVITADTLTWGAGWTKMTVATKGGYALNYKENNTPHTIDQQGNPVLYTPANSEGSVEINLAEVDLERLAFLLSNATLSENPAAAIGNAGVGTRTLAFGGSAIKEFQIGIEGLSSSNPAGEEFWELIKIWKCIPNSEFKKSYKKEELQMVVGKWDIAADLSKAAGHELFEIIEKTEDSNS